MGERQPRKWHRSLLLRLLALLLGLLPLLLMEWSLAVLGLPKQERPLDPYVDLHHLRPLFELNTAKKQYEIGSERLHLFQPSAFPEQKAPGTFRVFALGGSTTQGEPYCAETAFPMWLKLSLEAQQPERNFEVVNCGGLSYASYRVLAILREVLEYQPDLIVVYVGQNEFLEKRSYANWMPRSWSSDALGWLGQLHTVRFIRSLAGDDSQEQSTSRTELATEVDALLDYAGGLEEYHRDDPWREPVVDHFRWNIEQMILACKQREVPLILIRPVTNLADCPPFKFETDSRLSVDQQRAFEELWSRLRLDSQTLGERFATVETLLEMDPHHAGALYLHGRLLADQGDWERAKQSFIAARDHDVCPLRAITPILDAVTELAERHSIALVDAEQLLSKVSEHQVTDSQWLIDHVHPTIEGHQLIGEALAELCVEKQIVCPTVVDWRVSQKRDYAKHLAQLDEAYFHRGKQRLEGLMLWTQGRAKKTKVTE